MPVSLFRWASSIKDFFTNPIILSSITSWFLAQLIKSIISLLHLRKRTLRDILETLFWRTGGMPSSHTAGVASMTTAVAFTEGVSSNLFAVSMVFAMVVMRDALGVRRASGLQAKAINILGSHSAEKQGLEFKPVKEIQGHAPLEVIVGAMLGIFIAAAFAWL